MVRVCVWGGGGGGCVCVWCTWGRIKLESWRLTVTKYGKPLSASSIGTLPLTETIGGIGEVFLRLL